MSRQALLGDLANEIDEAKTLEELKRVLSHGFSSAAPIDLRTPIKFTNHTNDNALQIVNTGRDDYHGVSVKDADGRETTLGIGLGSRGLVANEVIPSRNFTLDPDQVQAHFTGTDVGSGYTTTQGFWHTITGIVKAGWGRFLDSYTLSPQTWHPPHTADQYSQNGNRKWMPSDPLGWTVLRCRVTAINNDSLTCLVIDDSSGTDPAGILGSTITVAKPCSLQRTPWDGTSYNGITYTYSDSQTRVANDGVTKETQVVEPAYHAYGESCSSPYLGACWPCYDLYVRWVGNRTDLASTYYIDLNVDARHWVPR